MFHKPFTSFQTRATTLIICAAPLAPNIAADDPAKPAQVAEAALPAAGTYQIDPIHSFAYFSAWHHIVGVVRGRFDKVTRNHNGLCRTRRHALSMSRLLRTASVRRTAMRDDDLRGPDFFNVTQFPTMTYSGNGIRRLPDGAWIMDGSLTIRGITKVVPMSFSFKGMFRDMPAGAPARAAFHGTASHEARRFWDDPRQSR